ncbi:RsiV family protein [Kaistella sp. 97-N-M2]|uniref:RsiV family protein n=1 Tax=Kaistella sp. 97-N-M2 TaxID=2908645 RepID=UPI001F39882E|nr:RsiV family protein [Kaistella sp. 97-N-M2]UJF29941.1 RsiV family protein [Kaistella sp. 97-N-M2]
MKKFFPLALAFSLILSSCNKQKTTVETDAPVEVDTVKVAQKFTVDSVKVDDSLVIDKNLTLAFKSQLLVFPQVKDSVLLDSIYAREQINLANYSKADLLKELQAKKAKYYEENKKNLSDFKPDFKQTWTNNSRMKVFSNDNELMTIQYFGDGFTGGAHGYYYEFYKVFDLLNKKTLQLSDVVAERDHKIWSRILIDNFLKNDLEKGQAEMLLVKEIPLNNNFYFDNENLYFLYNQYEITAYAAGPVLIRIPFTAIKPLLTSEFKTRIGL